MERLEGRAYSSLPGFSPSSGTIDPSFITQINFADKTVNWPTLLAVNVTCIVVVALAVSLRTWTRAMIIRTFFVDDFLLVAATFFTIVMCATALAAIKYGLGSHVWNLDLATVLPTIKTCIKYIFVCQIFYALAIAFTKLSIMALYFRIFPGRTMRLIIYATSTFTVLFCVASVCVTIFQCSPVHASWDFDLPGAKCSFPYINFLYVSAAVNVATDIIVCTMPLPYFWRLQMPRKQKLIVCMLFFLGGVACLASLIRIPYLHTLYGIDLTYNLVTSLIWAVIECSLGIVCVAIPPMRPLVVRLFPKHFRSQTSSSVVAGAGAGNGDIVTSRRGTFVMASMSRADASAGAVGTASQKRASVLGVGGGGGPTLEDIEAVRYKASRLEREVSTPSDSHVEVELHSRDSSTDELTDKTRIEIASATS